MTMLVFLGSLIGSMAIGMPIALALLACAIALMIHLDSFDMQLLAQNMFEGANSYPLLAVPLFTLAGQLMEKGGIGRRIINVASALVGHWRGGLGYVAVIAAVLLASVSGSAVADCAALASLLMPVMAASGFDRDKTGALLASSSVVAPLLPPSSAFIIFGVTANLSITRLFLVGLAPALMIAGTVAATWWLLNRNDESPRMPRQTAQQKLAALRDGFWALLMPVIIIGGLKLGIFTPTETGAVVAFYALFVGRFIYKELSFSEIPSLLVRAAKIAAVIMLMVSAAQVSSYLVHLSDLPELIGNMVSPFAGNQTALVAVASILIFVSGMVLEPVPAILVLVPILMPTIVSAGIDPYYFAVLFVLNIAIGLIHPPIGIVFNLVCGVGRLGVGPLFKAVMPFLIAELALLALLILFPALVLVPFRWLN